jgi:hypothetical protein
LPEQLFCDTEHRVNKTRWENDGRHSEKPEINVATIQWIEGAEVTLGLEPDYIVSLEGDRGWKVDEEKFPVNCPEVLFINSPFFEYIENLVEIVAEDLA